MIIDSFKLFRSYLYLFVSYYCNIQKTACNSHPNFGIDLFASPRTASPADLASRVRMTMAIPMLTKGQVLSKEKNIKIHQRLSIWFNVMFFSVFINLIQCSSIVHQFLAGHIWPLFIHFPSFLMIHCELWSKNSIKTVRKSQLEPRPWWGHMIPKAEVPEASSWYIQTFRWNDWNVVMTLWIHMFCDISCETNKNHPTFAEAFGDASRGWPILDGFLGHCPFLQHTQLPGSKGPRNALSNFWEDGKQARSFFHSGHVLLHFCSTR